MPTVDPADQQAARTLESSLREAVDHFERPPIELKWFLALPKRIRRSARLIESAQAESQVLLEHIQASWTTARQVEQDREQRLASAQSQPRNLDCLRAPDPAAWNGLGRRKRRCQAFNAVGRAYNARHRVSDALPDAPTSPADIQGLHPSVFLAPTPPSLRTRIWNVPGLLHVATGPADATQYGLPSPQSPSPAPSPPSAPPTPVHPPPAYPMSLHPGELRVRGREIDRDFAYVVARGRHAHAPQQGYTVQEAAVDIDFAEEQLPGALETLATMLFPSGLGQYNQMTIAVGLEPLVDFVRGWYELSTLSDV